MAFDIEQRNKFIEKIPEVKKCFQCGTCTSTCTAAWYDEYYNPREIVLKAVMGDKKVIEEALWRCVTCNKCNEYCPRGVNPYDVIVKLKNMAFKERFISDDRTKNMCCIYNRILESGSSFDVGEHTDRERKELGLSPYKCDTSDLKKLFKELAPPTCDDESVPKTCGLLSDTIPNLTDNPEENPAKEQEKEEDTETDK